MPAARAAIAAVRRERARRAPLLAWRWPRQGRGTAVSWLRWASSMRSSGRTPVLAAPRGDSRTRYSLLQNSSPSAPRNAPLRTGHTPGAETALFLYHPYFSGAQRPDGQWI